MQIVAHRLKWLTPWIRRIWNCSLFTLVSIWSKLKVSSTPIRVVCDYRLRKAGLSKPGIVIFDSQRANSVFTIDHLPDHFSFNLIYGPNKCGQFTFVLFDYSGESFCTLLVLIFTIIQFIGATSWFLVRIGLLFVELTKRNSILKWLCDDSKRRTYSHEWLIENV